MSTPQSIASSSLSTYFSELSPPIIQQLERVFNDEDIPTPAVQQNSFDALKFNVLETDESDDEQEEDLLTRIRKLETLVGKLVSDNKVMKDKLRKKEEDNSTYGTMCTTL